MKLRKKARAKQDKTQENQLPEKKTAKEKREKEPQYYKTAINMTALNYRVYVMSLKEKVCYTIIAFAIGALIGYVFYGGLLKDDLGNPTVYTHVLNAVIMTVTGLIVVIVYIPRKTESLKKDRQDKLKRQFRDMLDAFATSLGSGRNVTDSFIAVQDDLGNQYEASAYIIQELDIINAGIRNGLSVEDVLYDFGKRSGCEDIENFANAFEICYRRGGNIRETVRNTCDIIGDKMGIMENIETVVTSSKSELKLMMVIPAMMITLLKTLGSDFARNFASPAGVASTTVSLIFVLVAFFVGNKILDIKV